MKNKSVAEKKVAPLPCPFCGTKPKVSEGWGAPAGVGTAWTVTITCSAKKCAVNPQLNTFAVFHSTRLLLRSNAIRAWNKRNSKSKTNKHEKESSKKGVK